MKHIIAILALMATACSDVVEAPAPIIESADFDVVNPVLFPGDTTKLLPIIKLEAVGYIVDPAVEWSTSDSAIVRVTNTGEAIAIRSGAAQITMRYESMLKVREVVVEPGFVSIEAGPLSTCATMQTGEVYCWGDRRSHLDASQSPNPHPHLVPTSLRFAQYSVGTNHTCGVTADGIPYCWGLASTGGGGNGIWRGSEVPVEIPGGLRFTSISAAWEHTCALAADGVAYCWGRPHEGQLGNGTLERRHTPAPVSTSLRFKQLQAAGNNSCGLTVTGEAYCWGHRDYLGDTTITTNQTLPVRIPVPMLDVFDSANDDPCGITPARELYCWTNSVQKVTSAGLVSDVTVGGLHVCVKRLDDATWVCYGRNTRGQLGNGSNTNSDVPVAPAGNLKFTQMSAGTEHTCGVTDTGAAYCWGSNYWGQLGNRTRADSNVPQRVVMVKN